MKHNQLQRDENDVKKTKSTQNVREMQETIGRPN
jgi:hypothetical protein